jgi:hypothetical protein
MAKKLVNVASLIEVPDVNHGIVGAVDHLFTGLNKIYDWGWM